MPPAWILAVVALGAAAPAPAVLKPHVVARPERRILALAPLGHGRLLALEDDRLSLWRPGPEGMVREGERPGPAAVERVRWPGGLITAPSGDGGAWAMRAGWAEALLVSLERSDEGALALESTADALPWPGAPNGVRFAPGTSLIQGRFAALAPGPYLALAPDGSAAVDAEGRLLLGADPPPAGALRVGSAVARVGPDWLVASAPTAGVPDALLLIHTRPSPRVVERIEIAAQIHALTITASTVFLAVVDGEGPALLHLDLDPWLRAHP